MRTCARSLGCVWLFATPWTVVCQAPLSMGFFRQKYWGKLPFPTPGDLFNPGIKPSSLVSPALAGEFFFFFLYWRIIALQNFFVFCQTSTWISHRQILYLWLPGKSIEKRDHISNCAEVLLHFTVICWVATLCQIVRISLWSDCFILIFTGDNIKQMHLNVVRIQLDKGRIILLLRSLNTETCYQRVSEIFFLESVWKQKRQASA